MKPILTFGIAIAFGALLAGPWMAATTFASLMDNSDARDDQNQVLELPAVAQPWREAFERYGQTCAAVTPALLIEQVRAESDFNVNSTSSAGAQGIAQFLPTTWAEYGIDGDGDGRADIMNPFDAIASMAKYDCAVADMVKDVPGDPKANMLAAYNAGPAKVRAAGGVPDIAETKAYVAKILGAMQRPTQPGSPTTQPDTFVGVDATGFIAVAKTQLGVPYVWAGGGYPQGKTGRGDDGRGPGFDCSGFTQWVVGTATGGKVVLPRWSGHQAKAGNPVDGGPGRLENMQPGDLIAFEKHGTGRVHHVSLYVGDNKIIHSPHTGANVSITSLNGWNDEIWYVRRIQ